MSDRYQPHVGCGALSGYGSDTYANTVVEMPSPKTVVIQRDTDGPLPPGKNFYDQCPRYGTPNPDGAKSVYTLRKNGRWVPKGSSMNSGGALCFVEQGKQYTRLDPHF